MSSASHTALIERFAAACRQDPRIAAAFVGGSRGAGSADEHADSDLYLVLRDEDYDGFFAERRAFMGRLGDSVLLEDFNAFGWDMLLFIYADGTEGELILARLSGYEHIPNGPFKALLDRDAILPDGAFPPIPQPSPDELCERVRWYLTWFWRDLSQLSRYLARGRLWSAYMHREMLRETCLGLLRAQHGDAPSSSNHHNLESLVDEGELAMFEHTFSRPEHTAMVGSVRSLLAIYWRLGPPLAAAHGFAYPEQLERTVLGRFEQAAGMN